MTQNNPRHYAGDLEQMQSLPLDAKIAMTKRRIREWCDAFDGNVYVSFSGGKDSTVLLHIARQIYPDMPAVFCDTGLEYPEIRMFVKDTPGVTVIRPKMNFKQVIQIYGYPVISKEQSFRIRKLRHQNLTELYRFQQMRETHPQIYSYCMKPMDEGGLGLAEVLDFIGVPH